MLSTYLASLTTATNPKAMFISGEAQLTYGQLATQCGQTRDLFDSHGVGVDARVAIISQDRVAVAMLYLSCLAHGATAVVLDPNGSATELTVKLALVDASLIFADPAVIERCDVIRQENGPTSIAIGAAKAARTSFGMLLGRKKAPATSPTYPSMLETLTPITTLAEVDDAAPALILFTSGTTSNPKGVVLDRGALAAQMEVFLRRFGLSNQSRIVNHLPMHHTDGLNQGPLMALAANAELVLATISDMASLGEMLDTVYGTRATHLITVPTVLAMMDRLPEQYDDSFGHSEFTFIESTAGPLADALWSRIEDRFQTRVVNCYGLTETVSEALYAGPDNPSHMIGTVGKPDGYDLRIVSPDGDDAAAGTAGELLLRGRGLMSGYFRNDEATKTTLRDGWLHTGDLATQDADGLVRIVGRLKSLIIRGGINILPADVDAAAQTLPGVRASQTLGLPDVMQGERVVLCVVADPNTAEATRQQLPDHLRVNLAKEMQPNEIKFFDALPLGPSGKVDLPRLMALCTAKDADAGAGDLTQTVLKVAAGAFRADVAELSLTDGSDQIAGWDSLGFLDFVLQLERTFDLRIAPRDVMSIDTLGDAVAIVEREKSKAGASA